MTDAQRESNDQACYRCGDSLHDAHRIRLSAAHSGPLGDRCLDVERPICPDCLAGIGMLEFDLNSMDESPDPATPTRGECPPVRSRPG
ncbi:hypothetical protein [Halovivax gelatinilyticus]|uniref:hypothetical protein n=1 Tax=Halovivax gelatinilyticus TaxID=2961597 RepID=UPI0020CA3670|nr:hypothetical protein [Halovivax gelatinilyticus]